MGEVRPGDDLARLIARRVALADGDVVVVTQKIVSKAEGRLVAVDPDDPAAKVRLVERRVGAGPSPSRRAPDHRDPPRFRLRQRRGRPLQRGRGLGRPPARRLRPLGPPIRDGLRAHARRRGRR